MMAKGVVGESEEKREAVEKLKKKEVDVGAKAIEESTRDPSSPISDSSCQTTVAKPIAVPGRTCGPTRRSTKGGWTEEEDEILARAVKQFKGKNWKKIAEFFPGRSDVQCLHRWQKVLDPELIKGAWTKEEDERIIELVNKYGPKKWAIIARKMPGRIGKQCRERWHNHLNPAIKKGAWTTEEEITLIRAHHMYGNKWAEITKFLPGRADNSIKNHWNCAVKKKLDSYVSSGLLGQLPKIAALDLNNNPADTENTKGSVTQKISMIFGQKPIPAVMVNASSANLLCGCVRMPKEDPGCFNAVAQSIIAESLRNSKEFPGFIQPLGSRFLEDMNPNGRDSVYLPLREDINVVHTPDCLNSFLHKDGEDHTRALDGLVPTTPRQDKPYASIGSESSRLEMQSCECNTKEVLASPERFNSYAQTSNNFAMIDTTTNVTKHKVSAQQENMLLDGDKIVNYDRTPCTPVLVDKVNFNHDFHDPVQMNNLPGNINKAKILEPANSMLWPDSSVCFSAPPKLSLDTYMYSEDPETILRNAAKSFQNMPSILRKRHPKHLEPSLVKKPHKDHTGAEELCGTCNPVARVGSMPHSSGFACSSQCEIQTHDDLSPSDSPHVRQLFLSPSTASKSETYDTMKSVGKRLESAFDMEWNGANTDHTPSMVTFIVNNHVDISNNSQKQLDGLGHGFHCVIPETIETCK